MKMTGEYEIKACAKINLGLDVTGKREDGYHLLRMVMQNIGIADRLVFRRNDTKEIRIRSNLKFLPTGPKNLIYRTVETIRDEFGIADGVDVELEKKIPVAAGLAGGSTDAAAAILAMDSLFGLGMDAGKMREMGLKTGADVPFCLLGGTALAEGIGEILTRLAPMPDCRILLVKPKFGISTKYVYQAIDEKMPGEHPDIDAIIKALDAGDLGGICANMGNVLENVSCAEYPVLDRIKDTMREQGALNAMMSGSGPTLFGIFDDTDKAERAYRFFKAGEYGRDTFLTGPVHKEKDCYGDRNT
ncbi:MAG: 4-(cytidine 5'-diphospho)-2-C-methyl-D-erythritol kinase [Lachnospiraceae bacterium]|nr:4-(cytidine 5'-diphospho)-2-C-methyl-D-erythritol kinase [Lachnospiraceae bacterium]